MYASSSRSAEASASIIISSPEKRQDPEKSPAAEITANSIRRTPRRVQWAGGNEVRVDGQKETSPQHFCELDESGLDSSAFETLRNALETHQSGNPREGRVLPVKPPRAVVPLRITTSNPSIHHNSFANLPVPLVSHPLAYMNNDKPYPTASVSDAQASETRCTANSSMRSSTTDEFGTHLSSATVVAQRTHDARGDVWTDLLERGGFPLYAPKLNVRDRGEVESILGRRSTWRRGSGDSYTSFRERHIECSAEHQTADEKGKVTEHTHHHHPTQSDTENDFNDGEIHSPGRIRKGIPGSWLGTAMRTRFGQQRHSEDQRLGPHYGPKLGNGVLSALLALYEYDQILDDGRSMSRESISSVGTGCQDDIPLNPHGPHLPDQDDDHDSTTFARHRGIFLGKFNLGRTLKGGSASSIFSHVLPPSLPATSTTAALIVGAGALSGVAAPQHATLVPNLKRPGYSLVRYALDVAPETLPRTPSIISRTLRRAYSTDSSIAATDRRASEENESEVELPDSPTASIVVPPTGRPDGFVPRPKRGQTYPPPTHGERKGWTARLKDVPLPLLLSPSHRRALSLPHAISTKEEGLDTPVWSGTATPQNESAGRSPVDEFGEKKCHFDLRRIDRETKRIEERERKERQKQREKDIRRKRRKAEVYITRHVAEILERQEFIMKLARAMIMFGGPSHRLGSQIQSTGRVLDLNLSCMYLPDVMLISFEDSGTGTSNVKLIRQGTALDLEKLGEAHSLYWNVIHDNMSVSEASASFDTLMRKKPLYNLAQLTVIGGMCSAAICSVSFSGSFIDCLVSAPLGGLLVAIQLIAVRNELYAHVFEITIATLLSFLSAALASTQHFCYSAVVSSSVVLILPGYIVLSGSLELSSRSLVAGAVRICFAVVYSLFLGFGLAIGVEVYHKTVGRPVVGLTDYSCVASHNPAGPWWQQTPNLWWAFLTVPMYSLFLSMRLMAPWWKKEMLLCIVIASMGWVTNHFVGTRFPNQHDISAACGAFVVGFVSNMYGRFFHGNAFVIMITGILFQVPSGLGKGGLLKFASEQMQGSSSAFVSGFYTATQLISVALGLTVGLCISLVVVHPVQSRRRAGGLFSL